MSVTPSSAWASRVSLVLGLRWRSFGHLHDAGLCVQRSNGTSSQVVHDGHDAVMRVLSSRMSVWVQPKHLSFPSRKDDMLRKRIAHSFHLGRFQLSDPSLQYHILNLIRRPSRALRCAHLETVLELPRDQLQCPHPPRTGGLSPLRLLAPVVCERFTLVAVSEVDH